MNSSTLAAPRSRSRIILIRRWRLWERGGESFDRRCPREAARDARRGERLKGARRGLGRGPTRVSGERRRAPATSQRPIRTGSDAGTTRRALLAPLLPPGPRWPPRRSGGSPSSRAERSGAGSRRAFRSFLRPLHHCLSSCHCYYRHYYPATVIRPHRR